MLIGSPTAASATHTVALGGSGTLVAKGAGVVVPVTVTCAPSQFNSVDVQLSQRSGNGIVQGYGSANVVCDGTPHTVDVLVSAQGAPFKQGAALARASMFVCDFSGCHQASDSGEIRISR
ncbi:MAG: hypothetical protein LC799_10630 [Actinobacteria bacterium]|nr:hypothetical protein [Actinomycetota bacterium]